MAAEGIAVQLGIDIVILATQLYFGHVLETKQLAVGVSPDD